MESFFRFIRQSFAWIFVLCLSLFIYIGVKGFTFLMTMKYQTTPSFVPLMLDLGLEGIAAIVVLMVTAYLLVPAGKMSAAFFVLLLCSGFNGFNIWRAMTGQIALPLWEAIAITVLAVITGLVTFMGLRGFRRYRAQLAAEEA